MKKILLASTILVGTAGFAAADISFSGSAFMGVESSDGGATWTPKATASMDVAMSSETDGGLSFGADAGVTFGGYSGGATVAGSVDGATVWISGGFGKVSLDDSAELVYSGTFGAFGVKVKDQIPAGTWDIKLSYDFGNYSAYLTHNSASVTGLGGSADFGAFGVSVDISDVSAASTTYDLGVTYESGAISVEAHLMPASAWSLDASYDLGGGASIDASFDNAGNYEAGVSMKF